MGRQRLALFIVLYCVRLFGQIASDTDLAARKVSDPDASSQARITAAKSVLEKMDKESIWRHLGMAGPSDLLECTQAGHQVPNVTYVGHTLESPVRPLRPDTQVHFEIAAMLCVREFAESNVGSSEDEARLLELARLSTAIVGARAVSAGEQEVWDSVRVVVVKRIRAIDGATAREWELLARNQEENMRELRSVLRDLAKNYSKSTSRAIEQLFEARLKP